jgi:hypothetical protein
LTIANCQFPIGSVANRNRKALSKNSESANDNSEIGNWHLAIGNI